MKPLPHFEVICESTPAEHALAAQLVTPTDLLRLKAIARLHARLLPPDVTWSDLLQEAFARVLDGSRRRPPGLAVLPFLAGVMRSLKAAYWRRARAQALQLPKLLATLEAADAHGGEPQDPRSEVERSLEAMQELAAIYHLFADDSQARQVIAEHEDPAPGSLPRARSGHAGARADRCDGRRNSRGGGRARHASLDEGFGGLRGSQVTAHPHSGDGCHRLRRARAAAEPQPSGA